MKPKIGVVVCGLAGDRQFVTNTYIQSIRYSGGLPFILPLIRSDSAIQEYISFCDGFLFCGGNDITPLLFGEEPKNGIGKTNITLDLFQIRLMKAVLPTKKPVFSICRGMQVYNVACGGTIYQDLSLQPGRPLNHMQQSYSRSEVSHKIHVEKNSQLYQYVGSRLDVNSFHHQSVGMLGKNHPACGDMQQTRPLRPSRCRDIHLRLACSGTQNACTVPHLKCGNYSLSLFCMHGFAHL